MQESEYIDVYEFSSEVQRIGTDPYLHLQRTIRKQASKHCLAWYWRQKMALRDKRSEKGS